MQSNHDSETEDEPRMVARNNFHSTPDSTARVRQLVGAGSLGVWTATTFVPPSGFDPEDIFAPRRVFTGIPTHRFVLRRCHIPDLGSLKTMAIFTDGACSNNGNLTSGRGGCAFVFKPGVGGKCSFALEQRGPTGEVHPQTSNRAELRAVIAALRFRAWYGEGWERIVVITDSEYVGRHATGWLRKWEERGWQTREGRPVKNRDLWEALSKQMGELACDGCEVSFWTVPRRWNTAADTAAKAAVARPQNEIFTDIRGANV